MASSLTQYYLNQVGNGDTLPAYAGLPIQRGRGFGQVLKGLFRAAAPLVKRGAIALGKKALRASGQVATNLAEGKSFKQSISDVVTGQNNSSPPKKRKKTASKKYKRKARQSSQTHSDIFS